ncbi:MAG: hypothetical protein PUC15_08040 [Lentisphaeria bacterium]|nr:hypothetical protein [Lentisphaeria bacterium]
MGLAARYQTADEIPEDVRQDYVEDTVSEQHKGTWVLKDLFAVEKSLANERREHKETKAKITNLNDQVSKIQGELDKFHEAGTLEELLELRKKANEQNPPNVEELLKTNKELSDKLRVATKWRTDNEPRLTQLEAEQKEYKLKDDRASAKDAIGKAVKGLQGVNGDALSDVLYYQYLAGTLKRNEIGDIVTAADGTALEDFASRYAKEHGLILQNVSGKSNPPAGGGGSSKAALQKQYEEAENRGDTLEMLRLKDEISKLK